MKTNFENWKKEGRYNSCLFPLVIILIITVGFLIISAVKILRQQRSSDYFQKLSFDDPTLLKLIESHIFPPTLSTEANAVKPLTSESMEKIRILNQMDDSWNFINKVLKLIFGGRPPGFFIEVGALDGEYMSHSSYLEKDLQWTGLLVEPNVFMFKHLLEKRSRNVNKSDLCIGAENHYNELIFHYPSREKKKEKYFGPTALFHSKGQLLMPSQSQSEVLTHSFEQAKCFPLSTLILALAVPKVDVILLNINGLESLLLDNFPFEYFSIDVWIFRNLNKRPLYPAQSFDFSIIKRFSSFGYSLFAIGFDQMDYIMINKRSPVHDEALAKRPTRWKRLVQDISLLYP